MGDFLHVWEIPPFFPHLGIPFFGFSGLSSPHFGGNTLGISILRGGINNVIYPIFGGREKHPFEKHTNMGRRVPPTLLSSGTDTPRAHHRWASDERHL